MDYNFDTVDKHHILCEDIRFQITASSPMESLTASIARVGLINPPVLLPIEDRYLIICGFRRIAACLGLGWTRIPARCLDKRTANDQLALLAVAEAAAIRPLSIVEQARAWGLLHRYFLTVEQAVEAANTVGLALNRNLSEKLVEVTQLGPELWQGLHEGSIGLPVALRIKNMFDPVDADALGALLREMRWSLTRQKEILDWIETIVHRDEIPLQELISDPQVNQWRYANQLNNPEKSRHIRNYLKQRCYPTITAFQSRYARALSKIHISEGIEFLTPPDFEGQTFSLKINFCDYQTCLQRFQEIQQITDSSAFRELLEPPFKPDNP